MLAVSLLSKYGNVGLAGVDIKKLMLRDLQTT